MTDLEKLTAIRARCVGLLEIAEKRTPGEWKISNGKHGTIIRLAKSTVNEPQDVCRAWNCSRKDGNAAFIASCAGPAEAGWRATIAAIDHIQSGWMDCKSGQDVLAKQILTAWEGVV